MTTNPDSYEITETIPSGASITGDFAIGGKTPVGIYTPAAWTAADMAFEVSRNGSDWSPVRDADGNKVLVTGFTAGDYIALPPGAFNGINHLRIRSETDGTPVNQAADRSVVLVTRAFE